jgi:chromosomal replication initiation ATPase DnaA
MAPTDKPAPGRQLALDLGYRPARGRADFIVASSNADAVAWIDRWPEWPDLGHGFRALALHGPDGAGKSHLAAVWRERAADGTLIDDAGPPFDQRAFLHRLNSLKEAGGHLLLAGRVAPALWPVALPDLASRLKAMPAVALGPPDDALLRALYGKLFAERQVRVADEVIDWLTARLERSGTAAARAVAALDQGALERRRPVTIALAREVLGESNLP